MRHSLRKNLRWIGTILSLLLFVWLLAQQDWQAIWAYIQRIPAWVIPLALLLYLTGMVLNALRWFILLHAPPVQISFWETLKIVFSGAFASNFLPTTIGGDALRLASVLRFTLAKSVAFASLALDRIVNLCAFITVLPLTFLTFGSFGEIFEDLSPQGSFAIWIAAIEGGGLYQKVRRRLFGWAAAGRDSFKLWLQKPVYLVGAFLISWLSIFAIFLAIWLIAVGLGIPVALYQVMGVTAVTYLVTLIPISVNGYGLREVVLTALYTRLGATVEQAAILAVLTRFLSLSVTLPGALWVSEMIPAANQEKTGETGLSDLPPEG